MILTDKIKEAIHISSIAHKDQKRKVVGYPYISHPMAVLFIVSHFTDDEDVLVASILHDVVEDTDITLSEIKKQFGEKVRDIVDILTENDSFIVKEERKQKQLERFKNANHDVLLIKLADIIHNFCDIMLVLENYSKEDYLNTFGGNIKGKINTAEERISVIKKAWEDNPLLPEVKTRFEDYKNLLEKLELLNY